MIYIHFLTHQLILFNHMRITTSIIIQMFKISLMMELQIHSSLSLILMIVYMKDLVVDLLLLQ